MYQVVVTCRGQLRGVCVCRVGGDGGGGGCTQWKCGFEAHSGSVVSKEENWFGKLSCGGARCVVSGHGVLCTGALRI